MLKSKELMVNGGHYELRLYWRCQKMRAVNGPSDALSVMVLSRFINHQKIKRKQPMLNIKADGPDALEAIVTIMLG
ncbi:hypothetical protein [Komagataeibacter kakiaceti]|uniref:hypothetical protein n=1 Tax=Komagataeibacter kakiaceti TaxID=943261 RepID=UPI0011DDC3C3|nr:hypothetical protein [Komagataeibacter kakiaceti]